MELKSFGASINEKKIKNYNSAFKRTEELCNTEDAKLGAQDIRMISPEKLLSTIFMNVYFKNTICQHFANTYIQVHKDCLMKKYKRMFNTEAWNEAKNEVQAEITKKIGDIAYAEIVKKI